jgi:hypothetical protein
MYINITNADEPLDYTWAMNILENLWKTDYPCIILWKISSINTQLNKSSDCLFDYDINIKSLNNINLYHLNTFWVNKGYTNTNCWSKIWILNNLDWKNYDPKIWDIIIAKVNPEYNYIIELFPTEWKSVNNMLDDMKSLNIPYCTRKQLTKNNDKPQIDYLNNNLYIWFLIWIVLFLVVVLLYKKFKKYKK